MVLASSTITPFFPKDTSGRILIAWYTTEAADANEWTMVRSGVFGGYTRDLGLLPWCALSLSYYDVDWLGGALLSNAVGWTSGQ